MDRMACVDLPEFPLQLLLKRHPEWSDQPIAVVDADKPQGKILWANEKARSLRILSGMRFSAALSLSGALRAGVVSNEEIEKATKAISRRLRKRTPDIEPSIEDPGVFWLNASGLSRLYDSLDQWASLITEDLEKQGYLATIVVGYGRFGTYALAKSKRGVLVLSDPADEWSATLRVPLDRLSLDPEVRDTFFLLDVKTVGDLVDLPSEGIGKRFGKEAETLHHLASAELKIPLVPEKPDPPALERWILDEPETKIPRLLHIIDRLIHPILECLSKRNHALAKLHVGFRFERLGDHVESIAPSEPTLDEVQILHLIRLRLEAIRKLPDGVVEVILCAESLLATSKQLQIIARPKRDLSAAKRALARVRAELGEGSVTRAKLREGHLPEARFLWEPAHHVNPSRPRVFDGKNLVRRIHSQPIPLPSRPRHEPDGWMPCGLLVGPTVRVLGPYVISGGWWRRTVHREYYFAETKNGELLWIYFDRSRRQWFWHGRVE